MIINYYLGWVCLDGWDQVVQGLVLQSTKFPKTLPPLADLDTYTRLTSDGDPEGHCLWISNACGKMSPAALVSTMENGGLGFS